MDDCESTFEGNHGDNHSVGDDNFIVAVQTTSHIHWHVVHKGVCALGYDH